jgi:hypothetical protein
VPLEEELQRRVRDLHVAAQHHGVQQRHYLKGGKLLLGSSVAGSKTDHRWRFGVALGRATLSPKRRAEAISGHLLRTARSLPAEQSKSA